ncbi:MAG: flagellar basal-body protein FlbY [Caulobacterales bacterium]|nr:flagellar basal-body protein FlbY [Caulobacterales bacterium]
MSTGPELATARVRQLTRLTEDLTDRLINETRAFEARRPQDVAASLAETQEMANVYRRESAQLKANPALLAPAPTADRMALIAATQAFEAVLARHARAVEAARIVSEGLVKAIAQEVAAARPPASAYGATGRAASGDSRAVTLNRTA